MSYSSDTDVKALMWLPIREEYAKNSEREYLQSGGANPAEHEQYPFGVSQRPPLWQPQSESVGREAISEKVRHS